MTKHIVISIIVVSILIIFGVAIFGGAKSDSSVPTLSYGSLSLGDSTGVPKEVARPFETLSTTTTFMITLKTNHGDIVFETYTTEAPNTVANFITLTNKGYYNKLTFHRVIKNFMIQGGDPRGDGTGGPGYTFADEINPSSNLYKAGYVSGVVAMANAGPNTNGSQFFIMAADNPLPPSYTIFGKVISGMDVVKKINSVETDSSDKPLSPVVIESVSVK